MEAFPLGCRIPESLLFRKARDANIPHCTLYQIHTISSGKQAGSFTLLQLPDSIGANVYARSLGSTRTVRLNNTYTSFILEV